MVPSTPPSPIEDADRAPDVVKAALASDVAQRGWDLEDVIVCTRGNHRLIRIVVDADGGTELDELASASRVYSEILDRHDDALFGDQPYTLEVTSPGAERTLTLARHWRRARGRKVLVTLTDPTNETMDARVGSLSDDERSVDLVIAQKHRAHALTVALSDVASARVQVDFGRPTAAERDLCGIDDIPAASSAATPLQLSEENDK